MHLYLGGGLHNTKVQSVFVFVSTALKFHIVTVGVGVGNMVFS